MKELWLYCKKYEEWKSKEEFTKDSKIVDPCYHLKPEDPESTCVNCDECKITWVEED